MNNKADKSQLLIQNILLNRIDYEDKEYCFRVSLKLDDLIDDIKKNGQQFPVVLRTKDDGSRYQIVSGFRRCNALKEIGEECVKAVVRDELSDDDAYRISYIENEKRKNLSGMDKSYAVLKLIEKGKAAKEIQEIFGIGERQFFRLKSVVEFPREIKEAIADQFIQVTHGLVLMEARKMESANFEMDEWIDWIIEEKASVSRLKSEIHKRYRGVRNNFIKITKTGGFKLASIKYDPKNTDEITVRVIKREIMEAMRLLNESQYIENRNNNNDV